jgi:hypothetical protein
MGDDNDGATGDGTTG